jgi:bifunctional DNA-binding transcriptional regulator/antitoxin component of YhaV-PrlF toxin-antitoxin module
MPESTITAKGQTTVPADVRALVQAKNHRAPKTKSTGYGGHVEAAQRPRGH